MITMITPSKRQLKTLSTIDGRGSKIDRNSVFDCHLSPLATNGNQNYCFYWFLSTFLGNIGVFDCRLPGVMILLWFLLSGTKCFFYVYYWLGQVRDAGLWMECWILFYYPLLKGGDIGLALSLHLSVRFPNIDSYMYTEYIIWA